MTAVTPGTEQTKKPMPSLYTETAITVLFFNKKKKYNDDSGRRDIVHHVCGELKENPRSLRQGVKCTM